MKILPAIALVILSGSLLAGAGENPAAPVPVELNGIASFFGVRQAFFILPQAGADNFALSPGETKNGIKLIAIDTAANVVQIENAGQRQSLRLCRAPDLTASSAAATQWTAGRPLTDLLSTNNDDAIDPNQPGNPGFGTLPPLAGAAAAHAKKSSTDASGSNPVADNGASQNENSPAAANGSNPAEQLKSHANEDWYKDALVIEENRQNTVQDVLSGQMTPWPLTPLTPAGTLANLISHDGLFANHMPNFYHFSMTGDLSTSR